MATAKVKIFVGVEPDRLESDINDWLGRLPEDAVVQRTETSSAIRHVNNQSIQLITISIWYVMASN